MTKYQEPAPFLPRATEPPEAKLRRSAESSCLLNPAVGDSGACDEEDWSNSCSDVRWFASRGRKPRSNRADTPSRLTTPLDWPTATQPATTKNVATTVSRTNGRRGRDDMTCLTNRMIVKHLCPW